MRTTVMFVSDSEPLSGVPVRVKGDPELLVTDEEGKVEVALDLGEHTFEVQIADEWRERTVHRQGHAPLFVVNMSEQTHPNVSTLNTLQIDLSNLVGDRYVFETVLGRGGMGVVVKAIDRMLNRPVAIKMLSDELRENEEAQQIFLVEARNLATLSHPNLVAIHDILNVGGRVLMVFEYVLGENVVKRLKKGGRLDQKEVLRIAIQLTRCVSYLHDHDLIHRDLKPANIIMQAEGTLKLIDFGLARSLNELYIRGTRVRGTPAYMAPEQIQGIHLTTATDLYQIGISMYEMLAGKLPFVSGDMAYAHVHLQPPSITERFPDVDPELEALVLSCLSKSTRDRPPSAEILLEGLQSIYARLANRDSQPIAPLHDPTDPSGLFPMSQSPSHHSLASSSAAYSDAYVEEELEGGSDWVTYGVLAVGLIALVVAGVLFMGGSSDDASTGELESAAVEATPPPAAAATVTEPPVVPDPEPDSVGSTMEAASDTVTVGIATATGSASGVARAQDQIVESKPTRPSQRPRSVARPARASGDEARPKSKPKPTAKAEEPSVETLPSKPKKESPGLLSVEESSSKSLLPVTD